MTLAAGIKFPVTAAILGGLHLIGRVIYFEV